MTVREIDAVQEDNASEGHSERPPMVVRCCGEECASRMEAALEEAGRNEKGVDEEVR